MTETFFATQQVRILTRTRLATSRNRVLRGAGVTPAAKRTQGACRPRDFSPGSADGVEYATVPLSAFGTLRLAGVNR